MFIIVKWEKYFCLILSPTSPNKIDIIHLCMLLEQFTVWQSLLIHLKIFYDYTLAQRGVKINYDPFTDGGSLPQTQGPRPVKTWARGFYFNILHLLPLQSQLELCWCPILGEVGKSLLNSVVRECHGIREAREPSLAHSRWLDDLKINLLLKVRILRGHKAIT